MSGILQVLVTSVQTASTPVMSPTLVLSLDAENYSSGSWQDQSGNSNNATLEGTPTWNAANNGYFDLIPADGDYFSIPDATSLDSMNSISVEMWINIDTVSASGANMLFSKRITTSDGYIGFFSTTGWTFRFGTGIGTGLTYASAPATAVWQQIVATMGSDGSKFYINGTEVTSSAYTGNNTNVNTAAGLDLFEVNPRPQSGVVRMDGKVAIVKIYNGVISGSTVLDNFNASKTRFGL